MAAVTAYLQPAFTTHLPPVPEFSPELSEFGPVDHSPPINPLAVSDSAHSAITSNLPISEPEHLIVGYRGRSFLDDYYHRVHVKPAVVGLGNMLSNKSIPIEVWNAHLTPQTLNTILENGTDGMTLTASAGSSTFAGLENRIYTLDVSTDGPPVIDALYTFIFPLDTPTLAISGKRIIVFPFPPDWRSNVRETLEWLTQVIRSFDGSEQRRSLRTKPRRSFSFTSNIVREDTQRFENLLWGWQNRMYALPVWTDKTRTTAPVAVGAIVINADTTDLSFTAGGLAILFKSTTQFETVEIQSLTSSQITLARSTTAAWPTGTLLMPCVTGSLPTEVAVQRLTDTVLVAAVDFDCDPVDTDPYTPTAAATMTHDGYEVITRQPNWRDNISNRFEYRRGEIDFNSGARKMLTSEKYPRIQRSYSWLLKNRAQIKAYREMLGRLNGQAKPLLIPSWHNDFKVVKIIGQNDLGITVADNQFLQMVGFDPTRGAIVIRLKNGTTFYRTLTGVFPDGSDVRLAFATALGQDIPADGVQVVHFLMLNRLASDRVEIVWHTDRVAEVENAFINVKE